MNKPFKPLGYNSLAPYFIVSDAKRFMLLLTSIFKASELRRFDRPGGSIMHAEMKIDDSVIMLSQATAEYPAQPGIYHVYVPDVDATFRRALDAGCQAVEEPKTREGDPDRRGTFKDFDGNMWSVGTQQ